MKNLRRLAPAASFVLGPLLPGRPLPAPGTKAFGFSVQRVLNKVHRSSLSATVLAAALLAGGAAAGRAEAEPVKLLRPEQYRSRIVAPRKGRVLLVNFWATWCVPCREEMPGLVAVSREFPSKDLAVVLVSVDSSRSAPAEVPKLLSQLKVPFVCWLAKTHDPQDFIDAVDPNWDGSVPYSIVYGRDGKPAAKLAGRQSVASFSEAVKKALGTKAP